MAWPEKKDPEIGRARKHYESSIKTNLSSTLRTPFKYQLVYADVVLPTGTNRIFGILHNDKVYTRVSAFAPTGVADKKPFSPLSQRDYDVYQQWLKTPSKSKTKITAQSMHWVESNAEKLISEGNEKESKRLTGQLEYDRTQKLQQEFSVPVQSIKVGSVLEFQFDKSLWTVTSIGTDETVFGTQANTNRAPTLIGKNTIRGYRLV